MTDPIKPALTWRPINGYEGLYEVSDSGIVGRVAGPDSRGHLRQSRHLRPAIDEAGYQYVALSRRGKMHTFRVHRLVATTFIGPRPEGKEVNHRDGRKLNNAAPNLEYITNAENQQHALLNGLKARSDRNGMTLLSTADVIAIRQLRGAGVARAEVAKRFGVRHLDYITRITSGKARADALESYLTPITSPDPKE